MEAKRVEFQEAGSAQLGGMLLEFSWHGPRASLEEQKSSCELKGEWHEEAESNTCEVNPPEKA